jgi:hypothetical protein
MPKFEGQVNFSTLEGLSLYKKAIDLLSLYIPQCKVKYPIHLRISTIPPRYKSLCAFIPRKW